MAARRRTVQAALCLVAFVCSAPAQETAPIQDPVTAQIAQLAGRTISSLTIEGQISYSVRQIRYYLKTTEGGKLDVRTVRTDIEALYKKLKVRATIYAKPLEDGTVAVRFTLVELPSFEKVVFKGLSHFTEEQVRSFIGLREGEKGSRFTADPQARLLEDRYRRDGFHYVQVETRDDLAPNTLTFMVHEGPRVKIGTLEFVGNQAYPDTAFLGLKQNLVGSSGMLSKPGFFIFGSPPFSRRTLEDDLDKLRSFYRRNGYRDARVELMDLIPAKDRSTVGIKILVEEGPRYVVSAVELEQEPGEGHDQPQFPREVVMQEIRTKPGEFYSGDSLLLDRLAIERFYGSRGFPSWQNNRLLGGSDDKSLFAISNPIEVYDEKEPKVKIIYRLREGTRKRVRDVRIRGNTGTRDRVIRRDVSMYPGEMLDSEEIRKSQDRLDDLGYFKSEEGVSMTKAMLVKADKPDEVDLQIDVKEGQTGALTWGVGLSTNNGVFGNLAYKKENFDVSRPPDGWNPIDWVGQVLTTDVFHGAGQTFLAELAPGTEQSQARVSFYEPDLFGTHNETVGLKLDGYRSLRRFESYTTDTTGGAIALDRKFGRQFSTAISFRDDNVKIEELEFDAPTIVFDNEGSTEIRALRLSFIVDTRDSRMLTYSGLLTSAYGEYGGGVLGGGTDFVKLGVFADVYTPLYRDAKARPYVLYLSNHLDWVQEFDDTPEVHPNERLFMGGQNSLRGFEYRRAGPSQFGHPTGGEARWLGTLEAQFPIFSVRPEDAYREVEIIRGAIFLDGGLLGLSFSDPTFNGFRMSTGLGLRIRVPGLGFLPLAIDFAHPIIFEETDDRRFFHFRLGVR